MIQRSILRLWSWLAVILVLNSLADPRAVLAFHRTPTTAKRFQVGAQPVVIHSSHHDLSPVLNAVAAPLAKQSSLSETPPEIPAFTLPKSLKGGSGGARVESSTQDETLTTESMPAPLWNFDGVNNLFGGWPPDTQGDIGSDHYVQWVNLHFAIWEIDKQNFDATLVYGPTPGNALFQGFGGVCENNNDGDPITLFDPFDNRWFMSQFALPNYPNGPFYECVAVSATSDPTGAWYRYEFQMPVNKMNDYPKFGVWPNAYFMSVNQFNGTTLSWGGGAVAALERPAMLSGAPARMVFFDLYNVDPDFSGILPADFDGQLWPPADSPGIFAEWDDGAWIGGVDALRIWEFEIDWANPDEARFGDAGQPEWIIPTLNVDPSMCSMQRNCIPQPGTTTRLDAISDRLMYRLQYRNFGGYTSLVSNHTVDVDGTDHAGIHWFELRKNALGGDWGMHQEGIFAPDGDQRWMGSAAMDHIGNLALGYSVSSDSTYPSVRYAGRMAGDPPGTLALEEQELVAGSGSQTGSSRWGDYSMMGLDPVDDCSFWYTQEYVAVTGSNLWRTRVGAFRFPGCSAGPQGELTGNVSASGSGDPISGAHIQATLSPTQTMTTHSNSEGDYLIVAPIGTYSLEASAFGYIPETVSPVEVFSGTATVTNFSLEIAPTYVISGVVSDAQTGWPLYAKITPLGSPGGPVWSDPLSGEYSLELPQGSAFNLAVEAFVDGYQPVTISPGPLISDVRQDFHLLVNSETCNAPGYAPVITPVYFSDFEATSGGLSASGVTSWEWGTISSGPGSAHSGTRGWATNLDGDYSNGEDGTLELPVLDLSAFPGEQPAVQWWQWLDLEARYDFASLEASKDGGASWQTIYGPVSGRIDSEWNDYTAFLDPSFAVADLMLRLRLVSDSSVTYNGWYIDDVTAGVGECLPHPGSLVIGQVVDGNTGAGLNGAAVVNDASGETLTQATPQDPGLGDGFFTLFTPQGTHVLTATFGTAYQPAAYSVAVPLNATIEQDFNLPAGWLSHEPSELAAALELGQTVTRPLTLTNQGGVPLNFELVELRGEMIPLGPLEQPVFLVKPFKGNYPTGEDLGIPPGPPAEPLAAGDVISDWIPDGVTGAWAVAHDFLNNTVWVSSPAPLWGGMDRLYEFTVDGTATGRSYAHAMPHNSGPADLATDWNTGNLWIMNINSGTANCIYEIDPEQGYTGVSICPGGPTGFANSQRGLAYDPDSDTWFAGSWNDLMVHRFDAFGNILESVNVGLAVAGLAYNPNTQHLFVMTNEALTRLYVLDAAEDYELIGSFAVSSGFSSYAGGGLEFDCDGNLWAADLNSGQIVQFDSGEPGVLCERDVSWISTEPVSGTLAAGFSVPVTVTFDARIPAVDQPGDYTMQLKLGEDTPYLSPNLPVTMTVLAPASWGKLEGTVRGLGYCDADPQPLDSAEVQIESSTGLSWTVQTDYSGYYQRWLDEGGGPYTVTVGASEHLPVQEVGVEISAMLTTTLDADLFWEQPCVEVSPQSLEVSLKSGRMITSTLSLENSGHANAPYQWHEIIDDGGLNPPVDLDWLSIAPEAGSLGGGLGPLLSTVTFDASMPEARAAGVYTASLVFESNDPLRDFIAVPVTMTVLPLEYGVQLSPDQSAEQIPGEALTYTLTLTNTSEGLTDTIQLSTSALPWPVLLSSTSFGPIPSGTVETFTARVMLPETALPGQSETLTVTAISTGDPTKTASASLTASVLQPEADLSISQMASQEPAWAGQTLTYTLTITNHGPTSAPHAMLIDVLSTKVAFLSSDSDCSVDGTVVNCALGTLAAGEVRTIQIAVRPMQTGLLVNQALIASEAQEINPGDNFSALHGLIEGYILYFPQAESQ